MLQTQKIRDLIVNKSDFGYGGGYGSGDGSCYENGD